MKRVAFYLWYKKYIQYHCENCCKLLPKAIFLILLLIVFLGLSPYLIYAAPVENKDKAGDKTGAEIEAQAEKDEKEDIAADEKQARFIYEKMLKRTKECRDELNNQFFTVNSYARKAIEAKDSSSEREFINILSDYNSVLGDLGLMQVILDLGKSIEGEKFLDYYDLMESGFERLKDSFSLKIEVFLGRIDQLRNQDALRYEKKLLRNYKVYFEYDPRLEKIPEPEVNKGDKK